MYAPGGEGALVTGRDLFVGARMAIAQRVFELTEADDFTLQCALPCCFCLSTTPNASTIHDTQVASLSMFKYVDHHSVMHEACSAVCGHTSPSPTAWCKLSGMSWCMLRLWLYPNPSLP